MKIISADVYGFRHAMGAMRNPKNSWVKSDSSLEGPDFWFVGEKDQELSRKLTKAGSEHCKHLRMIQVWMDIEAPRYWWQEMDTYKHVEKISCSTMHKLFERDITLNDFDIYQGYAYLQEDSLNKAIKNINRIRDVYLESDDCNKKKELLLIAKNILPESFLQLRTINTNYQQLLNIYHQRKNHRLPQWREFCRTILELPYFKELTGVEL